MRFFLLALVAFAALNAASASVITGTVENFNDHVGGDKPAFVEFYAPWCGHCKTLAPHWDTLGETFKSQKVNIVAVDADMHRSLGTEFGVTGFPTLKWFPAGTKAPEVYSGGRTADDMIDFVNRKIGSNLKVKSTPSAVITLTTANFASFVLDTTKDALVEFYAPWCGHCKTLAPIWEKLGKTYEGDDHVVIGKVDATLEPGLGKKYGVSGYPSIKFFPKADKSGDVKYEGARDEPSFIAFLTEKAGAQRVQGGGFVPSAGRIADLDELAAKFLDANDHDRAEILHELEVKIADDAHVNEPLAKFYSIAMNKIAHGTIDYALTEAKRLDRMLEKGNLKAKDIAQFQKRKNILLAFKDQHKA